MTNLQGGFWTVLFFTLLGPFGAAFGTIVSLPVLVAAQVGPFAGENWGILESVGAPSAGKIMATAAMTAIQAYIWSAVPAALAGLLFAVVLAAGWPAGWAIAGMTGVIGFMLAAIAMPFEHGGLLAYIAVGAGLVAIACRAVAVRAGILRSDVPA